MRLLGIAICIVSILSPAWSEPISIGDVRAPPIGNRARRQTDDLRDCDAGRESPTFVNTTDQLAKIREHMVTYNFDAYIVPSEDAHGSEYIAAPDERRLYVSGFSGSAGLAIVTTNLAALWTDGRYFLQGDRELMCAWKLMKQGQEGVPTSSEWLVAVTGDPMTGADLPDGARVGFDPTLLSISSVQSYMDTFAENGRNVTMVSETTNLVDLTWNDLGTKPPYPGQSLLVLDTEYTGETWQDKITNLREVMASDENNADHLIVTKLDEIAWLFNLRGEDIPYNPMFISYAIVGASDVRLYVYDRANRLAPDDVRTHLNLDGCTTPEVCITPKDYSVFEDDLPVLPTNSKIWFSDVSSYFISQSVPEDVALVKASPILLIKSQKNEVEVAGMKTAHILDSIAICEVAAWMQNTIDDMEDPATGDIEVLSEMSVQAKSVEERQKHPSFQTLSFGTISSFGPNGAVIHYSSSEATNVPITNQGIYLLDSGGQYLEGTTDITRTFHFGEPTDFMKEAYTRVLMGHIDLVQATFRTGVYGYNIDSFARQPLWEGGLDFLHGTGHGIGHFLNVHEGPGRINLPYNPVHEPLHENMFFSDEPGYYQDGEFGMRIENVMYVIRADTERTFNNYDYMTFEMISFVPLEPKLIDFSLMTTKQIEWYNTYNDNIKTKIRDSLTDEAKAWVDSKTEYVNPNSAHHVVTSAALIIVTSLVATLMH